MRSAAHLPQCADGIGQSELLARQAGDETPAADFPARFEPVIDAQQLAPRRQPGGFALEQPPVDDAVAAEEGAGDVFDGVGVGRRRPVLLYVIPAFAGMTIYGCRNYAPRQRPPARILDAEQRSAAAAAVEGGRSFRLRDEQRAQPGEAVAMHAAAGHEFCEGVFELGAQQVRAVREFVEEGGAMRGEIVGDRLRA